MTNVAEKRQSWAISATNRTLLDAVPLTYHEADFPAPGIKSLIRTA
jgi:hypothetical protein